MACNRKRVTGRGPGRTCRWKPRWSVRHDRDTLRPIVARSSSARESRRGSRVDRGIPSIAARVIRAADSRRASPPQTEGGTAETEGRQEGRGAQVGRRQRPGDPAGDGGPFLQVRHRQDDRGHAGECADQPGPPRTGDPADDADDHDIRAAGRSSARPRPIGPRARHATQTTAGIPILRPPGRGEPGSNRTRRRAGRRTSGKGTNPSPEAADDIGRDGRRQGRRQPPAPIGPPRRTPTAARPPRSARADWRRPSRRRKPIPRSRPQSTRRIAVELGRPRISPLARGPHAGRGTAAHGSPR